MTSRVCELVDQLDRTARNVCVMGHGIIDVLATPGSWLRELNGRVQLAFMEDPVPASADTTKAINAFARSGLAQADALIYVRSEAEPQWDAIAEAAFLFWYGARCALHQAKSAPCDFYIAGTPGAVSNGLSPALDLVVAELFVTE